MSEETQQAQACEQVSEHRRERQILEKFREHVLINDLVLSHARVLSLLRTPTSNINPTHPLFANIVEWFEYLERMLQITGGIGLSSIQMNQPVRCFIFIRDNGQVQRVMNPQIRSKSEKMVRSKEGCLSFPFLQISIDRHAEIEVSYQVPLEHGVEVVSETLRGRDAIIFQHEYDHLDGILILDRAAKLSLKMAIDRRNKILRKIRRGSIDLSSFSPIS